MNAFAGTGTLTRAALRRSRLMIAAWIAAFVVVATTSAKATVGLYPSVADRLEAARSLNASQALIAVFGRVYDPTSIGAIAMIKLGGFGSVFVAMLAVLLVVRHTRADEEAGRLELVGATAVGRRAPLAAAFAVVVVTNVALAAATAIGLTLAELPFAGSLAFGLAWGGVGLAFGAIGAVAAQCTTSSRTATALGAAVLAFVYLLRAVGDAAGGDGPTWLTWTSPIGWAQQFRPYAGNRWWVLLITVGFTAVVGAAAFALSARRDLGTGVLPARPGRAAAAPSLRTPQALAWRLQRVSFAGWAIAFGLVGALFGNLASSVGDFVNNPSARSFFEKLGGTRGLTDAYLSVELGFAGLAAAAYGIQAVGRLHAEETALRAEPVLATAVHRLRWAASHVAVAVAGVVVMLLAVGVGAGAAHAARVGDAGEFGRVLGAALVQIPAALVPVAIAVAAFGIAPRYTGLGWAALAVFVVLGEFGPLLDLSPWLADLSPFAHVPKLPGAAFTAVPLVALTGVAALVAAAGAAGLRRRDIT